MNISARWTPALCQESATWPCYFPWVIPWVGLTVWMTQLGAKWTRRKRHFFFSMPNLFTASSVTAENVSSSEDLTWSFWAQGIILSIIGLCLGSPRNVWMGWERGSCLGRGGCFWERWAVTSKQEKKDKGISKGLRTTQPYMIHPQGSLEEAVYAKWLRQRHP